MSRRRRDGALVSNASDERQVRDAQSADERARQEQLDDLRAVLALPAGQRVLWRLMDKYGIWRTSWDPSAKIHFNEGQRNAGLFLMKEIEEADPAALWTMHKTVNQQRASEAAARSAERARAQESDDDDAE